RRRSAALATVAALLVWNSAVFVHFVDQALAKECSTRAGNVCLAWAPPAADSARDSRGVPEFLRSADYPFELGRVALSEGRVESSIELFRRALSMDQDHELAQLYMGAALIQANRFAEAIAHLNSALGRHPSNGDLQRLLIVAQQRAVK